MLAALILFHRVHFYGVGQCAIFDEFNLQPSGAEQYPVPTIRAVKPGEFESGDGDGVVYDFVVLEFMQKGSLRQLLREQGRLMRRRGAQPLWPWAQRLRCLLDVAPVGFLQSTSSD